jgi:16S rRNA (guanine527-N7)-methyltransferase
MDLKSALSRDSITFDDLFFEHVVRYKEHLWRWNKVHNLTGATTEMEIDGFILDAVYPVGFLPKVGTAMDIGTGAGFPGMILAMALPETRFTLVEPLKKRSSFLQYVKADLGLDNVTVKSCRVEELDPCTFDLITSRAVTDTRMLLELSAPYRHSKSVLLFYKGEKVFDEVDSDLPHRIVQTENRHYLIIEGDA